MPTSPCSRHADENRLQAGPCRFVWLDQTQADLRHRPSQFAFNPVENVFDALIPLERRNDAIEEPGERVSDRIEGRLQRLVPKGFQCMLYGGEVERPECVRCPGAFDELFERDIESHERPRIGKNPRAAGQFVRQLISLVNSHAPR